MIIGIIRCVIVFMVIITFSDRSLFFHIFCCSIKLFVFVLGWILSLF